MTQKRISGLTAEEWFERGYDMPVPEVQRECYENALALAPDNPGLWEAMGLAWSEVEEFEEAFACLDKVSGPLSTHPDHLCNLGYAYFRLKKYDDALDCYKRVIRQEKQHRRAWELSGELLFERGREYDASRCFRKAKKFPEPENDFLGELYAVVIKGFEHARHRPAVLSDDSLGNEEDFKIFFGEAGTYWGEHEQMKEIVSLLSSALHDGVLEPPLYLFFNVRVANGEIDCLVLMKHGPVILELKNYLGEITGSENGDWTVHTRTGTTVRVTSNVFRQCNKHRFDFYTKYVQIAREHFPAIIEHTGRGCYSNLIRIQSWGYFRQGSRYDLNQIAGEKVRAWFAVITADDLVERLKYVNAGYTLLKADMEAMARALSLTELSPEEYGWCGIRKEKALSDSAGRGVGIPSEVAVPGGVQDSCLGYETASTTKGTDLLRSRDSAYYCTNLIIACLELHDLKKAYKYSGDLIRYSPEEVRQDVIDLHTQLGCRLEGGLSEVPEELAAKADLILHMIAGS
ncbi:NERD domain-containing protein [Methanofollis sp. W23]|uniref:nuclease-related domain-containing protein n=1 Tax=Methanofollis sp. W23 TaxID=2817849 RepID=UPI001AE92396|nr:NERD domain-containing protein [Methanofollis sp. W23]